VGRGCKVCAKCPKILQNLETLILYGTYGRLSESLFKFKPELPESYLPCVRSYAAISSVAVTLLVASEIHSFFTPFLHFWIGLQLRSLRSRSGTDGSRWRMSICPIHIRTGGTVTASGTQVPRVPLA
jgi:hypothetical protein